MSDVSDDVFYVDPPDTMTGFPTWPIEIGAGHVRAGILDGIASVEYLSRDDDSWSVYYLDWGLDDEERGVQIATLAMTDATPLVWLEQVVPALLAVELPEIDAIQRLRLAARLSEMQARHAQADVVRDELKRLVVDVHGASVPAIPEQVYGLIAAAIERRDQDATGQLVHWIFENSPQRDDDPGVCRLVATISKAARG